MFSYNVAEPGIAEVAVARKSKINILKNIENGILL